MPKLVYQDERANARLVHDYETRRAQCNGWPRCTGSFPSSATARRPPSPPPSAAFFATPSPAYSPFPLLSTLASFDLCLRLSRLAAIATTSSLYLSPLSLSLSGKRRAAMYLPGGTTYVNLPHYILPGWANLNFPLSANQGMLGVEETGAVVNRGDLIFVRFACISRYTLVERITKNSERRIVKKKTVICTRKSRSKPGSAIQASVAVIKANFTLCIRLRFIFP